MKKHIVSIFAVFFAALFSTSFAQTLDTRSNSKHSVRSEKVNLVEVVKKQNEDRELVAKAVSLGRQVVIGMSVPSSSKPSRISVSVNLGEVYYDFGGTISGPKAYFVADRNGKLLKIVLVDGYETLGAFVKTEAGWIGDPIGKGDTVFDLDPVSWEAFFVEHVTPVVFLQPTF